MKRSAADSDLEPFEPNETPEWQQFLEEETLNQWSKMNHGALSTAVLQAEPFAQELLRRWDYQYVTCWLYKVTDSFVTMNYVEGFKPLWRNIKFDEFLLLQELRLIARVGEIRQSDNMPLYGSIRLQMLKLLTNYKANRLADWDNVINHHLNRDVEFGRLSLVDQFETLYRVVKLIEAKSGAFRNYLSNNLELFHFAEYPCDSERSLLVLPNVGVIIEKKLTRPARGSLVVPVKLKNCSVRYWDESTRVLELVHLDYSNEIQNYLNTFQIEYTVLATTWDAFLKQFSKDPSLIDFADWIPVYVEHQLYVNRILSHKEKEKSMAELLVRRKRSSRLVAREEETRRKDVENRWYEKLDEREFYLKTRSKLVAKQTKRIKDVLWRQLWQNFELDLKDQKLQNGHPDQLLADTEGQGDALTELEIRVIESGPRFSPRILSIPPVRAETEPATELPLELTIDQDELDELNSLGISTNGESADDKSWVFQCPGEPLLGALRISSLEEEEAASQANHNLFATPIVCCDACLTWQHWDCVQNSDSVLHTTARNYATVQLGNYASSRRASRKHQPEEQEYRRPIDKRVPLTESTPFICGYCASDLETKLRLQFAPELRAIKQSARQQAEERNRLKQLRDEKKRQQALQDQLSAINPDPVQKTNEPFGFT
ncbi:hypothetical protein HG536_0C01760 [Torulaspora globosa]|uniref:Uncharacterized protein n=1 Tax=Torulaspora globosa TaxID=48254 RepID=A0A7G3ZES2_9SACH|nr:uncharacterized protein HG536_0C01760 [Torulaspora globosa]QLL32008.1 hypothetical protein HG536_0C01760 [Torulaspora globosa]